LRGSLNLLILQRTRSWEKPESHN